MCVAFRLRYGFSPSLCSPHQLNFESGTARRCSTARVARRMEGLFPTKGWKEVIWWNLAVKDLVESSRNPVVTLTRFLCQSPNETMSVIRYSLSHGGLPTQSLAPKQILASFHLTLKWTNAFYAVCYSSEVAEWNSGRCRKIRTWKIRQGSSWLNEFTKNIMNG